jgi:hypothetical protein
VIIVGITLFGAAIFEVLKRRELAAEKETKLVAKGLLEKTTKISFAGRILDPALVMIFLITIAGVGTIYFAGTVGVDECKVIVREEKRKIIERKVQRQKQKAMFKSAIPRDDRSSAPKPKEKVKAKGTEQYNSVFDTQNLQGAPEPDRQDPKKSKGSGASPDVFNPNNLRDSAGTE